MRWVGSCSNRVDLFCLREDYTLVHLYFGLKVTVRLLLWAACPIKHTKLQKGSHHMTCSDTIVRADKLRILVADDEKGIREMFRLLLSTDLAQSRIDVAVNGVEVVECFRTVHHGVIIMDIHMPVKDGIQAYEEIREICEREKLKMPFVVFCTGYPMSAEMEQVASDTSRCRILHKPVSSKLLIETLKAGLSSSS